MLIGLKVIRLQRTASKDIFSNSRSSTVFFVSLRFEWKTWLISFRKLHFTLSRKNWLRSLSDGRSFHSRRQSGKTFDKLFLDENALNAINDHLTPGRRRHYSRSREWNCSFFFHFFASQFWLSTLFPGSTSTKFRYRVVDNGLLALMMKRPQCDGRLRKAAGDIESLKALSLFFWNSGLSLMKLFNRFLLHVALMLVMLILWTSFS